MSRAPPRPPRLASPGRPALPATTRRMRHLMLPGVSRLRKRPCGLDHSASPGTRGNPRPALRLDPPGSRPFFCRWASDAESGARPLEWGPATSEACGAFPGSTRMPVPPPGGPSESGRARVAVGGSTDPRSSRPAAGPWSEDGLPALPSESANPLVRPLPAWCARVPFPRGEKAAPLPSGPVRPSGQLGSGPPAAHLPRGAPLAPRPRRPVVRVACPRALRSGLGTREPSCRRGVGEGAPVPGRFRTIGA